MAKNKNGLGKGLASLIPSGPTKPRLGDSAADIVLGPRRLPESAPVATKALGKGGESTAWYASGGTHQSQRRLVSVGQSLREAAGESEGTADKSEGTRPGGLGGRRRGGIAAVIGSSAQSTDDSSWNDTAASAAGSDSGEYESETQVQVGLNAETAGENQLGAGAAEGVAAELTNAASGETPDGAGIEGVEGTSAETRDGAGAEAASDVAEALVSPLTATYGEISMSNIRRNPRNPRVEFDLDALQELAHSIREFGLLQPIVVREVEPGEGPLAQGKAGASSPTSDTNHGADAQSTQPGSAPEATDPLDNPLARYELIMGERRLRASIMAGLEEIPAIVRQTDNDNMLRDALLENIHRVQLNPLEEGAAYQQLLDDFGVTQEELARRLGRSRPVIANTIRLLQLPAEVRRRVAAGVLSAGHARALLGLKVGDESTKVSLAERIVREGMSVRATEEAVTLLNRDGTSDPEKKGRQPRIQPERMTAWASDFGDFLDTSVKVQMGAKKGKIVVEFAGEEDFDRIVEIFRSLPRGN